MSTALLSFRSRERMALLLVCCLTFLLSCYKIYDYDEGWHLKQAEYVLQHHSIPEHDFLGLDTESKSPPIFSLLPDLFFYLIYLGWGFKGLILAKALLVSLWFALLFLLARSLTPRHLLTRVLVLLFIFAAIRIRLPVRPLLFSYLGFAGTFWALLTYLKTNRREYQVLAGLLIVLNAQLHLEWYLSGLLWITLAIAGTVSASTQSLCRRVWNVHTQAGLVVAGCVLLTAFLSPLARQGVLTYPIFGLRDLHAYARITDEIGPLYWSPKYFRFFGYLLFSMLAWIAAFSIPNLFTSRLQRNFLLLQPFFWVPLAFFMSRNFPYTAMALFPVFCLIAGHAADWLVTRTNKIYRGILGVCLLAGVILLASSHRGPHWGFGLDPDQHSEAGLQFLREHLPEGNLFNHHDFGGILALTLYPQKKIFMDGRSSVFPNDYYVGIYEPILHAEPDWENRLEIKRIGACVLRSQESSLALQLMDNPNWGLVFWDPVMMIFYKKLPGNIDFLNQYAYRSFDPFHIDKFLNSQDPLKYKELARLLSIAPQHQMPNLLAAREARAQRDWPKAIVYYQRLLEMGARKPYPATNLGLIFVILQDYARASYFLELGVKNDPEDPYPQRELNYFISLRQPLEKPVKHP